MQENTDNIKNENIKPTRTIKARLENYWYHYKWHSIIAIFLIITITVCSIQMCNKDEYDCYVMYAGDTSIAHTGGGVSEYANALSSLNSVSSDFDGNGRVLVSFSDLYVWTNDQMSQYEKDNKNNTDAPELHYTLISQDKSTFSDRMTHSEYYLCFLSIEIFNEYKAKDGLNFFVSLTPYLTEGNSYEMVGDGEGILLGSVEGFAGKPGISSLPYDTVICLRAKNEVFSGFDKKAHAKYYSYAEETLKNILSFE